MTRVWSLASLLVVPLLALAAPALLAGQPSANPGLAAESDASPSNKVVLILPFHNDSKAPGLEWVGEAFSEVLAQRMQTPSVFVISREDRLYAFDRVGIPSTAQLSRATLLKIAEQMDVDYVVLGNYDYDGNNFAARAQLLDMRRLHLTPPVSESGSLLQLVDIQAATAWDLMHQIQPRLSATKQDFLAGTKDIRLDALENYVRGVIGTSNTEKIRRFKEAIRLNPNYSVATLELGKTYFNQRDYPSSIMWLSKVPQSDKHAMEANFFLGLAAYYSSSMERAAEAFRAVADRMPLTEVYNNLGVVEGRRSKNQATDYFDKAVQADPTDPDYHFNLAICLARNGDKSGAIQRLKETLDLRPADSEAKNYLDALSRPGLSSERPPLERIKRNYDEASYRQLAFAIENAEEAQMAHLDPKKHSAKHVDRGNEKLRQGFYEEARDHFREAITLDAQNMDAHLGLANTQIALNDLGGARSELETSLRSKPSADVYAILGQLDLKENKLDAADQDVAQALRLQPDHAAALQLKQQLASKIAAASRTRQ